MGGGCLGMGAGNGQYEEKNKEKRGRKVTRLGHFGVSLSLLSLGVFIERHRRIC